MRQFLLWVILISTAFRGGEAQAQAEEVRIAWRRGAELEQAVGGPAGGVLDGKPIVAGGTFWENAEKKFWISKAGAYDPEEDKWQPIPDLPRNSAYSCAVSTGEAVYVFGGASKEETWRETWKLVKEDNAYRWEAFVPMPVTLCNMEAALVGSTAYIVAGTKDGNDLATSVDNNVWRIDLASDAPTWESVIPLPGPLRCGAAVASSGGRVYVFGGAVPTPVHGGSGNSDEAYVYDPDANRWERVMNAPYAASWWWATTYADRYILLAGGHTWSGLVTAKGRATSDQYGFIPEVLVYDTQTGKYSLSDPLPMGIIDNAFVRIGETLYLSGGEDAPRHRASWLMIGEITLVSKP